MRKLSEQVFLKDFGRRQVLALRQTLTSKILDLEKKEIYDRYEDRIEKLLMEKYIKFGEMKSLYSTVKKMS